MTDSVQIPGNIPLEEQIMGAFIYNKYVNSLKMERQATAEALALDAAAAQKSRRAAYDDVADIADFQDDDELPDPEDDFLDDPDSDLDDILDEDELDLDDPEPWDEPDLDEPFDDLEDEDDDE